MINLHGVTRLFYELAKNKCRYLKIKIKIKIDSVYKDIFEAKSILKTFFIQIFLACSTGENFLVCYVLLI